MSTSISDFKVFVSDEIFDFRTLQDENMNDKTRIRSHSICKCDTDNPPNKNSNANAIQQKIKKAKPRPRSRTVDPRFRRSRSPTLQGMNTSQSTNTVNRIFKARVIQSEKPLSISSPAINNQTCMCRETQVRRYCNKIEATKKDETQKPPEFITEKELNFMEGNDCNSVLNVENSKNKTDYKQKPSNKIEEPNHVNCEEKDIQCTFEEELDYNEILNSLSTDNEAVSRTCLKKPYWEDVRYRITKGTSTVLSSNNLSFLTRNPNYPGSVFCHIYPCVNNKDFTTYKYDQGSEVCTCSMIHDEDALSMSLKSEHYVSNSLRTVICSIIGISLVSFIVWLILNFHLEEEKLKDVTESDNVVICYYNKLFEYLKNIIEDTKPYTQRRQRSYWLNII